MQETDIMDGDILIIDKSLEPLDNDTAVCSVDGEFILKCISTVCPSCLILASTLHDRPVCSLISNKAS